MDPTKRRVLNDKGDLVEVERRSSGGARVLSKDQLKAAQAEAAGPPRTKPKVELDPTLAAEAVEAAKRFRAESTVSKRGAAAMAELVLAMAPTTEWLVEVIAAVRRVQGQYQTAQEELDDLVAMLSDRA